MRNKITIDYIQDYVKKIEPKTILVSKEYINNRQDLKFVCGCGKEFVKTWDTISSKGTCKCRSCARKIGRVKARESRGFYEDAKILFAEHGYKPLSPILNSKDKVLCEDENGYRGYISYGNVKKGQHFSVFSVKFNKDNLLFNANRLMFINNCDTKVVGYEKGNYTNGYKLNCICSCGRPYTANLGIFTTQRQWHCQFCSKKKSKPEFIVEEFLKEQNINFVSQKRFKDCVNPKTKYPLPFDIYFPSINFCIEIDGPQHEKPVLFYVKTQQEAENKFQLRKELDEIKTQYCINNNIGLLRIPTHKIKSKNFQVDILNLFNQP